MILESLCGYPSKEYFYEILVTKSTLMEPLSADIIFAAQIPSHDDVQILAIGFDGSLKYREKTGNVVEIRSQRGNPCVSYAINNMNWCLASRAIPFL